MSKYPKLIESLDGFTLKHWSKMKVGDEYTYNKIRLKRRRKYKGKTKILFESYYIVPDE